MAWRPINGILEWDGDLLPDDPRHGTERGYRLHYKRGFKPCPACALAKSLAMRAYYERTRLRDARPCADCGDQTTGTRCRSCAARMTNATMAEDGRLAERFRPGTTDAGAA